MLRFIGRRLIQMAFLFFVFLTVVFFLLLAQPGDITGQFIQPDIPAEVREQIAARLGLDGSPVNQWWNYITNFFRGNLGVSFSQYPRPVMDLIAERIPRTLFLFTLATLLSYFMGFKLGKRLAWRRGGLSEYGVTISGVLLYTVFYPWFAVMMIVLFASRLGWFPINGFLDPELFRSSPFTGNQVFAQLLLSLGLAAAIAACAAILAKRQAERGAAKLIRRGGYMAALASIAVFWWVRDEMAPYAWDIAHHAVLPIVTLALVAFAGVMLLTRGSMLETLKEDYILTARAKGVPEKDIRDKHAARNALLPVVTSFVLGLAFIIGGGIITETVFGWPGMGQLLLDATVVEDIPVATGALAFTGILALIAHLGVDLLYAVLDPRIRIRSDA